MPKTKILNRSRRRSYGGKVSTRNLTGRKRRALEKARIWEVKAVENITSPETKTPWRAPRGKPDPGQYACQTLGFGCAGCTFLLFALPILAFVNDGVAIGMGVGLLMLGFLGLGGAVHSFLNSRGGW